MIAAVHGLKSVTPRRRIGVTITPYELRVAPEGRRHGTRRYGRDRDQVVTIATTTSGHGEPRWMIRAARMIEQASVTTVEAARAIADAAYARRYARDAAERLVAEPGWIGDTPITPEATLRAAGIDDGRQAAYQRRMSALLAGRDGAA